MKHALFRGAIGLAVGMMALVAVAMFIPDGIALTMSLAMPVVTVGILALVVLMPDKLVSSIGESIWKHDSFLYNVDDLPAGDGHSDPGRSAVLKSVIATCAFLVAIIMAFAPWPYVGPRSVA